MALVCRKTVLALTKQLRLLRLCSPGVLIHRRQINTDDSSSDGNGKKEYTHENKETESEPGTPFMENEEQEIDIKQQILDASLQYVPEHGWTPKAIESGVQSLGLSSMATGMFPRSGGDLVLHFIEDCNTRLADYLHSQAQPEDGDNDHTNITKERGPQAIIQDALEVRLRMLTPFIDQWPQAMGLMLMPQSAPDAVRNVAYMVDEIWYHAGDTSTDINWYSKRGVLAALYGATEMYMVHDKSFDFEETWSFLDKRMADINTMIHAKSSFEKASSDAAGLVSAAFTTIRNMSGFNSKNR